jgi:hypothetical protein
MPPFGEDDSDFAVRSRPPHVGIARRNRVRPSAQIRRKAEPLREVAMSLDVLIEFVIWLIRSGGDCAPASTMKTGKPAGPFGRSAFALWTDNGRAFELGHNSRPAAD